MVNNMQKLVLIGIFLLFLSTTAMSSHLKIKMGPEGIIPAHFDQARRVAMFYSVVKTDEMISFVLEFEEVQDEWTDDEIWATSLHSSGVLKLIDDSGKMLSGIDVEPKSIGGRALFCFAFNSNLLANSTFCFFANPENAKRQKAFLRELSEDRIKITEQDGNITTYSVNMPVLPPPLHGIIFDIDLKALVKSFEGIEAKSRRKDFNGRPTTIHRFSGMIGELKEAKPATPQQGSSVQKPVNDKKPDVLTQGCQENEKNLENGDELMPESPTQAEPGAR